MKHIVNIKRVTLGFQFYLSTALSDPQPGYLETPPSSPNKTFINKFLQISYNV